MSGLRSLPIEQIVNRKSIESVDVRSLRRIFHADGIVTAEDADVLFKINKACPTQPADWPGFFIEAVTDYLVFQERPQGYLTAANVQWLLTRISSEGRIQSKTELELLVNVIDKARWAPVSLAKFALEQVKAAVSNGDGPLRNGKPFAPGEISESEVELLRRILYAFGGDGHVAITRDEADVLFDIDDVVTDRPNPAWTDLFVKAITNVIMAASGYRVPAREEALRPEMGPRTLAQKASPLMEFLSVVQANISSIEAAYHAQTTEERALARLEHQRIEIITNQKIAEAEPAWLLDRLGRGDKECLNLGETALFNDLGHEPSKILPFLTQAVASFVHAA
jgi:hypothetical protein